MTFEINGLRWYIVELDYEAYEEKHKKLCEEQYDNNESFTFGCCNFASHEIFLNKYVCREELKKTLIHELVHCWLWSYGARYSIYYEDALCDTVAASYDFIHKIVDKWSEREMKQ